MSFNDPQNFKQVQNGVDAFCDKRSYNYLDLFVLVTSENQDLTQAILGAMTKWLERNSKDVPMRHFKFVNAEASMGGKHVGRLPNLTKL